MFRTLRIKDGIIGGDKVRRILEVFPEIETKFTQRKTYDEYYYNETKVELSIQKIDDLNQLNFSVIIDFEDVIVD